MTTIHGPEMDGPEVTLSGWLAHDHAAVDLGRRMVALLRELPGVRSVETQVEWEQAALAAVALRRGRRLGRRVGMDDFAALVLGTEITRTAWVVSGDRRRDEERERQAVLAASGVTRLVLTVYWVVKVEVAREHLKRSTWMSTRARAERETESVLPDVAEPQRSWLQDRLAMARHPLKG